jgi:hypothetical protein
MSTVETSKSLDSGEVQQSRKRLTILFVDQLIAEVEGGGITSPEDVLNLDTAFRQQNTGIGDDFSFSSVMQESFDRWRSLRSYNKDAPKTATIETTYKFLVVAMRSKI